MRAWRVSNKLPAILCFIATVGLQKFWRAISWNSNKDQTLAPLSRLVPIFPPSLSFFLLSLSLPRSANFEEFIRKFLDSAIHRFDFLFLIFVVSISFVPFICSVLFISQFDFLGSWIWNSFLRGFWGVQHLIEVGFCRSWCFWRISYASCFRAHPLLFKKLFLLIESWRRFGCSSLFLFHWWCFYFELLCCRFCWWLALIIDGESLLGK